MCGIGGIVSLSGKPVADAERRIGRMMSLLRHRGPDRQGIYLSPDGLAAFTNTRLAIVDVGTDFDVPMVSIDGGSVLTFNGEIYNFEDERNRLLGRGVRFRTRSDTEVLLEGLRLEGEDFLDRLDGFWGFGYYDVKAGRLILSRDLLGERHVFYCADSDELIFASEMNPVLAVYQGPLDIDVGGMVSAFRFRAAPPGRTLVNGVGRLLPGYNLIASARTGEVKLRRYRRLHPEKWFDFFARKPSESQVLAVYEEALDKACRSRVPREVGYMVALSGGLDSALASLYASEFGQRRVRTLYGSSTEIPPQRGDDLDELAASQFTAAKIGANHHVFSMIGDDCLPVIKEHAANSFDGLFCEAVYNYQQLADAVAAHEGRVLIVAEGPDEFIGGYEKDISAYRLFQHFANRPLQRSFLKLLTGSSAGRRLLYRCDLYDLVNWSFVSDEPFHFRTFHGGTTPEVMSRLFEPEEIAASTWRFGLIPPDYNDLLPHLDLSQRMALSYATVSLPDYSNVRSDRGGMRSSIEVRLPMQAPHLVELMIATPAEWRFKGGRWTKFICRKLVERHVGREIAYRGKYLFAMPAWRHPRLAKLLDFESTIADSPAFHDLPFRKGAREFFLKPEEGRSRWFAYCLAATYGKLRARDFSVGAMHRDARVGSRPIHSAAP